MNIEIAIRILKELKNLYEAESTTHKFRGTLSIPIDDDDVDAIETLLTAYEKEKEKNKELSDKLTEKICKGVEEEILEEYRQEIEHQKEKRENQKKELAILNAKQAEFNKLVNTVNSYKGQFKRQQKEIEELKEIYQTGYVNGCVSKVYEINKKWKDKIKEKIEEVKDGTYDAKIVLQSLLEKE